MKNILKRLTAICVCIATLVGVVPSFIFPATAAAGSASASALEYYDSYSTITNIYNYNGCTGMQGLAIDGNYLYSVKINSSTQANAFIARTHKDTGSTVYMTNSSTGTTSFTELYHANDLEVATIAGKTNLFVATSLAGENSLIRYEINGTKLTKIGNYSAVYSGSEIAFSSAKVISSDDSTIKLLCKKGKYLYYATLGVDATSGTFELTNRFTLNVADVVVNGVSRDLSTYLHQGFEYIDNKIFVPITGDTDMSISIIAVYNIEGVSGTIKNDPALSFEIHSSDYPNKFEIESCAISPVDGKLYFNTNRAVTSSNADHDALHYFTGYVYDPTQGDSVEPGVYRWEVNGDSLQSATTGGAAYNGVAMHAGSISDGEFTDGRYYVEDAVVLNHDRPWIVEWKSTGSWGGGGLLFSANSISKYTGNTFIFRRQDSTLIAIGEYTGSQYNNYGLDVSDYGIDATVEHVYSLRNHIADDGSNMVYVYVDGEVLGPMDNYYLAGSDQGTKSNWLSGKDFVFSYIGTDLHPITDCSLEYIQVWGNGAADQFAGPKTYRWETQNNALTAVNTYGLTDNTAAVLTGNCANGVYSGTQVGLRQDVVLLHDRPWSMEWQCEGAWTGGSRFIAAGETSRCVNAPFIYRQADSGIIAFGYYTGSQFNHYGIKLSDHGIDGTVSHVYRLTNRIEADGSNMIYLYVDGVELGAMNNYYVGHTNKGTTSDWVSGRDFTFSYFGTYQHGISDVSFGYIQFWENGIPADDTPNNYRWETQSNTLTSVTDNGYTENTAVMLSGSITDGAFSGSNAVLDESVVLLHDRQWSISWQSEGSWKDAQNGAMLLASSENGNTANTVYLYRRGTSEIIALGHRYNSKHHNYGIKLSDHGIDGTASHTYQLTNRINSDGSNMVYLYVDGVEMGAMNNYYVGGVSQGTTDNWISGKDFVFSYLGTENFTIGNCSIDYLQINEGCTHSYGDWTTVNATCTADGTRTRTCSICGGVETETIAATGHSWVDASCTEARTCTNCGEIDGEALGHSYQAVTTAPDCTKAGSTTYTCTVCGDCYTETIPATGHSWVDATCTDPKTCATCGETEGEKLSHNYQGIVKSPTCTRSGYTTYTCTDCGDSYIGDVVSATGHVWSDDVCGSCGTVCEHSYDNGFCTACDGYQSAAMVDGCYEIYNAGQLYWFAALVNAGGTSINGKLMNNITINSNVLKADGTLNGDGFAFRSWIPIGNRTAKYSGAFNGNDKTVSGLYLSNSTADLIGLFGYVSGGTVQKVGIVDSYFCGIDMVGGITGVNYGTITNCFNAGIVKDCISTTGGSGNVGGVTGINYGTVSDCYNTGIISGQFQIGGVVGYNYGAITDCYNTGSISGDSHIGGVAGCNDGGTITGCYNTGSISGVSQIGGVAGSTSSGTISVCYNTGTVSGGSMAGGVVGYNYGSVNNCYNTAGISGSSYIGGVVGMNDAGSVANCYNTGAISGTSYVGGVLGNNYKYAVSNCYYLEGTATVGNTGTDVEGAVTVASEAQFASGEVAYLLNGSTSDDALIWYQTIGTDNSPGFAGETVYAVTNCLGNTQYSNTDENISHIYGSDEVCDICGYGCDHTYANGICTICGWAAPVVRDSKDIKWQVTSGTNADSASTNLRLVSWVSDVDDYESVTFNVTINGRTVPLVCTTAYTAIKASGVSISNPAGVFGEETANYFVTHTIMGIPAALFDSEILVTVTWTDLEGNSTTSDVEAILISSDWT